MLEFLFFNVDFFISRSKYTILKRDEKFSIKFGNVDILFRYYNTIIQLCYLMNNIYMF